MLPLHLANFRKSWIFNRLKKFKKTILFNYCSYCWYKHSNHVQTLVSLSCSFDHDERNCCFCLSWSNLTFCLRILVARSFRNFKYQILLTYLLLILQCVVQQVVWVSCSVKIGRVTTIFANYVITRDIQRSH